MDEDLKISLVATIASAFSALAAWTAASLAFLSDRRRRRKEMYQDHKELRGSRKRLWGTLILAYNEVIREENDQVPERLEDLIRLAGSPPYREGKLSLWPEVSRLDSAQLMVWKLASLAYPLCEDPEPARLLPADMFPGTTITEDISVRFDRARMDLVFFWDSWASFAKMGYITKRYKHSRAEILFLSWLEIAKAKRMGETIEWKARIFRLAKKLDRKSKRDQEE